MKRGQLILLAALGLGLCMFFCTRLMLRDHPVMASMPQEHDTLLPELEWLRDWLRLDEAQFRQVRELHLAYRPRCRELCMRAHEADASLLAIMRDPGQDFTAALKARAELQAECQQAMLGHVRQTAALMTPEQARQYLDSLLPHVLGLRSSREDDPARSR